MRTSRRRTLVLESAVAILAVISMSAIVWPSDLGLLDHSMHPVWLAAIVLAARYGLSGLFTSLGMMVVLLIGVSLSGLGRGDILLARFEQQKDIYPLLCAVGVAWVAMSHEGRFVRVLHRWEKSVRQRESEKEWANALHETNEYLRARCDRMDVSLSFLRWVSRNLERGDLASAADAALLLCLVRTGAMGGCVASVDRLGHTLVASRGLWNTVSSRDLAKDRTLTAAALGAVTVLAVDVPDASDDDSDVGVPVLDELDSAVIGVIALRGVDPLNLRAAELSELALVSEWLSPTLARQIKGPRLHTAKKVAEHEPG